MFVRDGADWRAVGAYPDATAEEALAYFERKYQDLAGQVTLLEQRVKRAAPAADVAKTVAGLTETLREPAAVGDLQALRDRVAALGGTVESLTEKQNEQAKEQLAEAIAERTAIVTEIEALAAQDLAKIQWKQAGDQVTALFARWQEHQQSGPRLPKGEANELWKRFRTARSHLDSARRSFFAELDATHKDARNRKQALVERAEALIPRGADAIPEYRRLLDEWKQSGRAGRKQDDALWAKFKAAGDAIYQAKAEIDAQENEEYEANLVLKRALLDEAEPILAITDREQARQRLTAIQLRWDEIGRVPRESLRPVEDRLRAIEQHVKQLDDRFWANNNPEKKARSQGLAAQLEQSIAQRETELAEAKERGDAAAIAAAQEALDAQRTWLDALG
ncbi:DUF349 domain-containing protein [Mycetocola reblochoni]|uniref:ATPase involved in DNA repair n=2 Tax=Mycetocola reblochoni TaxID=331618 RepID=A0A1R4J4F3_9MICO|nr:DUF349 domain-containing protein [Mycetocola reblochoni]SJN26583.1 ATPase involved in DNA repair [Mycetocola reblochoni REB411]